MSLALVGKFCVGGLCCGLALGGLGGVLKDIDRQRSIRYTPGVRAQEFAETVGYGVVYGGVMGLLAGVGATGLALVCQ